MKKIKKLVSLAGASLVMAGLIFSTPINTRIANAEIYRGYKYRELYYYSQQTPITGKYYQKVSFKMRIKSFQLIKGYSKFSFEVKNGFLVLTKYDTLKGDDYIFDDDFMMIVTDEHWNVRFKWVSNYKPQATAEKELEYLMAEIKKLKIGLNNRIMLVPKNWTGTLKYEDKGPYCAIKKIGYNNWGIGYNDDVHKYSTSLQVTNEGLKEVRGSWGNYRMFESP